MAQSPESLTTRLDLEKMFGRAAALQVDLGCGDGSFVCALAQRLPDKNFLGIERLSRRIRSAEQKAAGVSNVRLLQVESSYAVRYLLPAESVEAFYLLFPDPWPKRRHRGRRIVTANFLNAVRDALRHRGLIHIATDHFEYFQQIKVVAESALGLVLSDVDADLPQSRFGLTFQKLGAAIHWLALRKASPVK